MSIGVRGVPVIIDDTATSDGKRINVVNPRGKPSFARYMRLKNVDTTISIKLYFTGTAYVTIAAGQEREFFGMFTTFVVQSASSTAAFEAHLLVAG